MPTVAAALVVEEPELRSLLVVLALVVATGACTGPGDGATEATAPPRAGAGPEAPANGGPPGDPQAAAPPPTPPDAPSGTPSETPPAAPHAGDVPEDEAGAAVPVPERPLQDLTTAAPGTWPVGDAGTVTFAADARGLRLVDVAMMGGWVARAEADDRHLVVTFRRDRVRWVFEARQRGGGRLSVELRQDVRGAPPGSYDLGHAGTFAFRLDDGRLRLTSLRVRETWEVADRVERDDRLRVRLQDGGRSVELEVTSDDGATDLAIDYRLGTSRDGDPTTERSRR